MGSVDILVPFATTDLAMYQHMTTGAAGEEAAAKEAAERRESVDSGLSTSPPLESPPPPTNDTTGQGRTRKKKKRLASTMSASRFHDLYSLRSDVLGQGSYGRVETCVNIYTNIEYAVKIINKDSWAFNRQKMLKEIELYYLCQGHPSIIQLIEYFEETECFYLIFEKAKGGHLLDHIQRRVNLSEPEAAQIITNLAKAIKYLHSRGIAHRDLKPENILCMSGDSNDPDFASGVRLCDFDLCSSVQPTVTTPRLTSPVGSAEYMAPEVVDIFVNDDDLLYDLLATDPDMEQELELTYDKRADLWSLGVIAYTLLCGFLPFHGSCGRDCGWSDRNEECFQCQQTLFNAIKRNQPVFPDKYWGHISPPAMDLIVKLLKKDPNDRIDAEDILSHPWIANKGRSKVVVAAAATPFSKPVMGNNMMKKSATSMDLWSKDKNRPVVKASAKMRRQSSVVNFYPAREDLLICRCEF